MRESPLEYFNDRPDGISIDTIIVHCIHAPDSDTPFSPQNCIALLIKHSVAAHYIISRKGEIIRCVQEDKRAWHAGKSRMPLVDCPREEVNDFSIGIELIGSERSGFTVQQYDALVALIQDIRKRHEINHILGHEHVSPGRKSDPGKLFDWSFIKDRFGGKIPRIGVV